MFIYTMYTFTLCIVHARTHAHKQVNQSFAYIRSCMDAYNFIIGTYVIIIECIIIITASYHLV